ncbi:cytochrome P450 2J3-like [Paramacrobiotus metropolitanus]|uniref:cytochrome P450 2J3-like n=1 Tax=Paramacrobiotus metropolitanus TaxID=2943436 RepID=UPI0024459950|nr:cytochrome P450 2J3-like [Paramacrobiotus metropolitanus]
MINMETFTYALWSGPLAYMPADYQCAVIAFAVVLLGLLWYLRRAKKNLPPSPLQFPIIGCLPFLDALPHVSFTKWAKKFGKIFSCRLGGNMVIVLNDADLIREAFSKPVFNGRPHMYTAQVTSKGMGISFASDETWPVHRRFAFKTFKTLGVGKGQFEGQVAEETERLVKSIASTNGMPFDNKTFLQTAVGNVLCGVLFGMRYDAENRATCTFYDNMNAVFQFFGTAGALNIFPFLRIIPTIRYSFSKVVDALEGAAQYIAEFIKNQEDCWDSSVIADFTDAFIKARKDEKTRLGRSVLFTDQQYIGAARELFLTGYDTTTSTLRWAFLYIARDQAAQAKIQQELDEVVGKARYPNYADLARLPYTQAALFESQRLSSIGPLGIPHRSVEETELCGYTIPKDAWIFTNLWHIHRNEAIWSQPDEFHPDRFLDATGTSLVIPKDFIPFSTGKRSCPGESIAKMQLFLIFATVLQQFSLELEGECSLEPHSNGITLDTHDYLLRATAR